MTLKISLAPIQGITDYVFRNTFHSYFSSVDYYYAPYLRIDRDKQIKPSKLKDILPEVNLNLHVIPQMLVNNSSDFIYLANFLFDLGYSEINWNLGCPYPMVTNRQLGAGLLTHHDKILGILDSALPKINGRISIKMRTGLTNNKEIEQLLPKFNSYSVTEIIIHPRFAKQLYKEKADLEIFESCIGLTSHKLCYNGDIDSSQTFRNYQNRLSTIDRFMIGRGLVANPFLAEECKGNVAKDSEMKKEIFEKFYQSLYEAYLLKLNDKNFVLARMKAFWEYFSQSFSNSHKVFKKIKKASTSDKYHDAIQQIFNQEEWIA
jgi:tRNA-dihydrouridine synthase B